MSSPPPRRSTRISKTKDNASSEPKAPKAKAASTKKRSMPASPDVDKDEIDEENSSSQKKPRKRVKTTAVVKSARRNAGGKLKLLMDTPVDVVLVIFSHVEPLDLLRLSRTTKALRKLLMSKSSIGVWQSARLGMEGLPPMIEGLNEPQYANLLFDTHCHNCLKTPTKYIIWAVRMRLCKQCLEKGDIMATEMELLRGVEDQWDKAYSLCYITPSFQHGSTTRFHRASHKRLVEESAEMQYGTPEYDDWLMEERKALGFSCQPYEKRETSRTEARAAELASLRRQRLDSIIAHLTEDGWEYELEKSETLEALKAHELVNQPKALTDRSWETINPAVVELMCEMATDAVL
ncbi:hypothetical protein BDZ89DRAFT_1132987 [Hymenopellis radicata]|nr:hypothetical protein BDZ89DRAFT_1132987 [Hymenopellis radicata]